MIQILPFENDQRFLRPGSLSRVFRACREQVENMNADIRAGLFRAPMCAHGDWSDLLGPIASEADLRALTTDYPLALESPFEEVETIAGGIWKASNVLAGDDAILRLSFKPGTVDLPLHSHDHSDRIVFVVEGEGTFEVLSEQSNPSVTAIQVSRGQVLVFPRGTVHSFRTPSKGLELISYHSPFIELDDPMQFTVLETND
ncbi:MAG TPA: hypothetical protein DDW52_28635 [Planctomycetaceae bacterium]|nr:hypothetical protein [Planctomycetaceae bacterium]